MLNADGIFREYIGRHTQARISHVQATFFQKFVSQPKAGVFHTDNKAGPWSHVDPLSYFFSSLIPNLCLKYEITWFHHPNDMLNIFYEYCYVFPFPKNSRSFLAEM